MKKIFLLAVALVMSMLCVAGESDLLWDYTLSAPQSNPDNGLFYGSKVDDAADTRNGLKGIKLNSSGWCSFSAAPPPRDAMRSMSHITSRPDPSDFTCAPNATADHAAAAKTKPLVLSSRNPRIGVTADALTRDACATEMMTMALFMCGNCTTKRYRTSSRLHKCVFAYISEKARMSGRLFSH